MKQIVSAIVLNAHSIVCGPAFKYLVSPDCRIKHGIGMQGIHPDAIAGQFKRQYPGQLRQACLGHGIGPGRGARCRHIFRTDHNQGRLPAKAQIRNTFSRNVHGSRQIDVERPLPLSFGHIRYLVTRAEDPGIVDQNIEAPESRGRFGHRVPHSIGVLDVTNPSLDVCSIKDVENRRIFVENRDLRALFRQCKRAGISDPAGASCHQSTASLKSRRARRFCKFCLLKLPVLDLKNVCFRQSAPSAVALRRFDGSNSMGDDIADHGQVTRPCPESHRTSALPHRPPRGAIQSRQLAVCVAIKVVLVFRNKPCEGFGRILFHYQRNPLCANHMIWRQRSSRSDTSYITAFGKAAALHTTIKRYQHGAVCGLAHFISDRSELKGRCFCCVVGDEWVLTQGLLRLSHEIDHTGVTFPGVIGKTEDPVIHEDHSFQG